MRCIILNVLLSNERTKYLIALEWIKVYFG